MLFDARIYAATLENLRPVIAYVETCAGRSAVADQRTTGLLIAVEEAFVNICHYAYPDERGEVVVTCGNDQRSFEVEIKDRGIAFNPLSARHTQEKADIMNRPVGGLGVLLIREFCDEVCYRREDEWNILRLIMRRAADTQS